MNRKKNLETFIIILTSLLLLWVIYKVEWLIYIALILGIIGSFFNPISTQVTWFWYKIASILGNISSKILLSLIFFLLLSPLAFLYRKFNKDTFQLKKKNNAWFNRNYKFEKKDLEKMW